jgi:hypothetical protein
MPRTCTVCSHPQRRQVEQAMIAGTALRTIAGQFGPSKAAIMRHRAHAIDAIARNTEACELARTGVLLDDVRAGEGRAERLYQQAEAILMGALQDKDRRTALQAIRAAVDVMGEARSYMELRGELTNELGRDRTFPDFSVQIICPSTAAAAAGGELPRVSFAAVDSIDAPDDCIATIGLLQRP